MTELLHALFSDEGWGSLSDGYRPLAYTLAALVCFLLGTSPGLAQRTSARLRHLWLLLCPLYLLVAANALVQGDVLWVHWARDFSRAHHVYEERRLFQLAALLVLLLLASKAWQQYQRVQSQTPAHTPVLHSILRMAGAGTLALLLLRYVSFHYTDLALNAMWLKHSVASWVECACLAMAAAATGLEIARSYGHV